MTGEVDDWFAVNDPLPPDDFHTWARPASPPCPNCNCCAAALCEKAIAEHSACHWLGGPSDFNLSMCPCWRGRTAEQPVQKETPDAGA